MTGGSSPTFDLLLCAARGEDCAGRLSAISDWNALLKAAQEHKVIPLIARALCSQDSVPLATRRELDKRFHAQRAGAGRLQTELAAAMAALAGEGIPAMAYKGPAFAALAYPDPALRHAPSDLDLLLPRGDILRAKRVLEGRGYSSILSTEQERHFLQHRYHLHLERRDPEMHIELHWAVTPAYWPFPLDTARLQRRTVRVNVAGSEIPTLDPESTLLALCAHGAKEGWPRLCQVCDLARLIEAHPGMDWDYILGWTRKIGRSRVVGLGLALASELLPHRLPSAVSHALLRDPEVERLAGVVRGYLREHRQMTGTDFHRFALGVWSGRADRLRYLWYRTKLLPERLRLLAEPSASDHEVIQLEGRMRALYFLIRPVRALVRHDARFVLRKALKGL